MLFGCSLTKLNKHPDFEHLTDPSTTRDSRENVGVVVLSTI